MALLSLSAIWHLFVDLLGTFAGSRRAGLEPAMGGVDMKPERRSCAAACGDRRRWRETAAASRCDGMARWRGERRTATKNMGRPAGRS